MQVNSADGTKAARRNRSQRLTACHNQTRSLKTSKFRRRLEPCRQKLDVCVDEEPQWFNSLFTRCYGASRCSLPHTCSHMGLKGGKKGDESKKKTKKTALLHRALSCWCVLPQATITSLPWPTWQAKKNKKKQQLNENCHLGIMVDVLQNTFFLISAKI